MDRSRRSSNNYNYNDSPETPTISRRTSGHNSVFSTPNHPGLGSPIDEEDERPHTRAAGSQSDPRNGALIRRPTYSSGQSDAEKNNLYMEIGRYRTIIEHLESEKKDYELKEELSKHRVEDLQYQVDDLKAKLRKVEDEHSSCPDQIMELEQQLDKCRQTIRVQANQIRNPRDGRVYGPPQMPYEQPMAITSGRNDAPRPPQQSFEMVPYRGPRRPRHPQTAGYTQTADYTERAGYHNQSSMQHGTLAMRRSHSQKSNPCEDDSRHGPKNYPALPSQDDVSRSWSHQAFASQHDVSSGALVPRNFYSTSQAGPSLHSLLSRLFNTVENWAVKFANDPNRTSDAQLSYEANMHISQITNPDHVVELLADPQTRYFAITKLILYNVINFSFYPVFVRGFRDEYDERLLAEKSKIYTGVPSHIRRESIAATAGIIDGMLKDPDWERFLGQKTTHRVGELWETLSPFMDTDASPQDAWRGILHVWEEAVRIGLIMLRQVSIFSIDFPPIGPNSPFNPTNMVSLDPGFKEDPLTLGKMGLKVRLSISPVVTVTCMEVGSSMQPRPMAFAKVLLMR